MTLSVSRHSPGKWNHNGKCHRPRSAFCARSADGDVRVAVVAAEEVGGLARNHGGAGSEPQVLARDLRVPQARSQVPSPFWRRAPSNATLRFVSMVYDARPRKAFVKPRSGANATWARAVVTTSPE